MSVTNYLPFESEELTASGIATDALTSSAIPGIGTLGNLAKGIGGSVLNFAAPPSVSLGTAIFGPNAGARVLTALIGLLLISAAIFTHPTVINVGKKAGRAAAELGAAA